jgi:hypothetical protein
MRRQTRNLASVDRYPTTFENGHLDDDNQDIRARSATQRTVPGSYESARNQITPLRVIRRIPGPVNGPHLVFCRCVGRWTPKL